MPSTFTPTLGLWARLIPRAVITAALLLMLLSVGGGEHAQSLASGVLLSLCLALSVRNLRPAKVTHLSNDA